MRSGADGVKSCLGEEELIPDSQLAQLAPECVRYQGQTPLPTPDLVIEPAMLVPEPVHSDVVQDGLLNLGGAPTSLA